MDEIILAMVAEILSRAKDPSELSDHELLLQAQLLVAAKELEKV